MEDFGRIRKTGEESGRFWKVLGRCHNTEASRRTKNILEDSMEATKNMIRIQKDLEENNPEECGV